MLSRSQHSYLSWTGERPPLVTVRLTPRSAAGAKAGLAKAEAAAACLPATAGGAPKAQPGRPHSAAHAPMFSDWPDRDVLRVPPYSDLQTPPRLPRPWIALLSRASERGLPGRGERRRLRQPCSPAARPPLRRHRRRP